MHNALDCDDLSRWANPPGASPIMEPDEVNIGIAGPGFRKWHFSRQESPAARPITAFPAAGMGQG